MCLKKYLFVLLKPLRIQLFCLTVLILSTEKGLTDCLSEAIDVHNKLSMMETSLRFIDRSKNGYNLSLLPKISKQELPVSVTFYPDWISGVLICDENQSKFIRFDKEFHSVFKEEVSEKNI